MAQFYLEKLIRNWDEGLVRVVSPWQGIFNRVPLGLIQVSQLSMPYSGNADQNKVSVPWPYY